MTRAIGVVVVCVVLLGAAYLFYQYAYPSYTYRYRMTVEVEVDGVVHSGASVIEITLEKAPRLTPESHPVVSRVKGEAIFVDLGGGRNVTALLASGPNANNVAYPEDIVSKVFGISWSDRDLPKYVGLQDRRNLTTQQLPTFVTFGDLSDPKSVRVVVPEEFARVFGPGTRLKVVWIEMTSDPVTRGIEQKMPAIIGQLRERAKTMQVKRVGDPFVAELGLFYIGG